MKKPFTKPRRTAVAAGATSDLFAFRTDDRVATKWAICRHEPLSLTARSDRDHGTDHFRNHVARSPDDHLVTDPQVLSPQLVLVVKCGERHFRSADIDRLKDRERRRCPGTPDVDLYLVESR